MLDYDSLDEQFRKIKLDVIEHGDKADQQIVLILCDLQFRLIPQLKEKQRKALEVMD